MLVHERTQQRVANQRNKMFAVFTQSVQSCDSIPGMLWSWKNLWGVEFPLVYRSFWKNHCVIRSRHCTDRFVQTSTISAWSWYGVRNWMRLGQSICKKILTGKILSHHQLSIKVYNSILFLVAARFIEMSLLTHNERPPTVTPASAYTARY